MRNNLITALFGTMLVLGCSMLAAQTWKDTDLTLMNSSAGVPEIVPNLVRFNGTAHDPNGKLLTGVVGITFALYRDRQGGSPLWLETQNVTPDLNGHYSVLLGSTKSTGVPADLFISGEARWVGVQLQEQPEQPRVLLLTVPYAMKAADAETIGGLPPSAFVLAAPSNGVPSSSTAEPNAAAAASLANVTGGGTANFVPLWTTSSNLGDSVLFQSGSGTSAKVGINTSTPQVTLDVQGSSTIRGALNLPATGTATATSGKNSQPEKLKASAFNSSSAKAIDQVFEWQAEPTGNNTSSPGATLNLLFGTGSNTPAETGLKLSSNGLFTFASGQTFPGAGTITGITAGSDLTGGGTSGNITLNLDTTKVPLLASANTFNLGQTVKGNLTLSGTGNGVVFPDGTKQTTASSGGGGGTVTSVALSAPSSDFTVSGSPVTGSGTLSLAWSVAPTSSNTANAIVKRDSSGNFSANAVSGNLFVSTGAVNGQSLTATNTTAGDFTYGILGQEYGSTGRTIGVEGIASNSISIGVAGNNVLLSVEGASRTGFDPTGAWGDGGDVGWGIVGTVDNGNAVLGYNNSDCFTGGCRASAFFENDIPSVSDYGYVLSTYAPAGNNGSGGQCIIDSDGNLLCNGFASSVVPLQNGARNVALYAVHSPQNWFEDFGSGQLSNGTAVIHLEATFSQTVNTSVEYHVFLTPNGDSRGLYVTNKMSGSFEVREQGGGKSNIAFDYRIVALRKGSESLRLQDRTEDFKRVVAQAAKRQGALQTPARPASPASLDSSALVNGLGSPLQFRK